MYQNTMGKRKANDKPVAPTTTKKWYFVAEACDKILDSDDESLLGNDFVLLGVDMMIYSFYLRKGWQTATL